MKKFVIKSIYKTHVIDIVEARNSADAIRLVEDQSTIGPLYSGHVTHEIESVDMVESFSPVVQQIHPGITDQYMNSIIELNTIK